VKPSLSPFHLLPLSLTICVCACGAHLPGYQSDPSLKPRESLLAAMRAKLCSGQWPPTTDHRPLSTSHRLVYNLAVSRIQQEILVKEARR
jgi:hypothetical protein